MKAQTREEATGYNALELDLIDEAKALGIPEHYGAILEGLKPWEYEFSKLCQYLIWTRRMQNRPAETKAAHDIGEHLVWSAISLVT